MVELHNLWSQMVAEEVAGGPVTDPQTYAFAGRWFHYAFKNCVLAAQKQADYGSKNITMTGLYGVGVRMLDKVSRLLNLTKYKVDNAKVDESIEDTMGDLSNYGIIGQMVHDDVWGEWDR